MDVAINELSFSASYSSSTSDAALMRQLLQALKAIKDRVADTDRSKVRFRVADAWLRPRRLPGGTTIGDARKVLDDVERGLWMCFFDYPGIPVQEPPTYFHATQVVYGLGYALENQLVAASLAQPHSSIDEVPVESRRSGISSGTVPNVWSPELAQCHAQTMALHIRVLPRYSDPGHHDPASVNYKTGKSHLPIGVRELFHYAHRDDDGASWWTKCECHALHRFHGGDPVHWSGSTNRRALDAIEDREVPASIRAYWKYRPGVVDCGCR